MRKADDLDILNLNPQIDMKRVADFEEFRREAEQAGIDLSPKYRVSPPLGELETHITGQRLSTNSLRNR